MKWLARWALVALAVAGLYGLYCWRWSVSHNDTLMGLLTDADSVRALYYVGAMVAFMVSVIVAVVAVWLTLVWLFKAAFPEGR